MKGTKIYVLDDEKDVLAIHSMLLEGLGFTVRCGNASERAVEEILEFRPDVVLMDVMMPGPSGFEILRRLRARPELAGLAVVMLTSKGYEHDRQKAYDIGADAYISKPLTESKLKEALASLRGMKITFWGVRGTLPVPGARSLRYGGNTSCVTLALPRERLFIFDAGTGIKELSNQLMKSGRRRLKAHLFITHPHWDHINAFPFFVPLYLQGNHIIVHGPAHEDLGIKDIMAHQMDGVYFPVTIREFAAHVEYADLTEGAHEIDGITVRTKWLTHPGMALGYRVEHQGRSFCYITDDELYPADSGQDSRSFRAALADFVRGADVLIHDTTYLDHEYKTKIHWGHSCVSEVVKLAHDAEVKTLYLSHHDPDHGDDDIDKKLAAARALNDTLGSKVRVEAAAEGQEILL